MTKHIFITGDRSMESVTAASLVSAVLSDIIDHEGLENIALGTGNAAFGVERAVRYLVPEDRLNVFPYETTPEGKPDFKWANATTDEFVFLHMDPLSSSIGKALSAIVPPEKISMPLQEAGLLL